MKTINIDTIAVSNTQPMILCGGLNVLESRDLALKVAEHFATVCARLNIPYIFKASFDKANRSSVDSFRGLGLEKGLEILRDIKTSFGVPILTDIHQPDQATRVAEVADVLQIPAFLSRQTDLIIAAANTSAVINIKKAQFMSPNDIKWAATKCAQAGNERIMLCERGTCFGYNNLVVDMLGFDIMKQTHYPVIFDVTHALQKPGGESGVSAGRRQQLLSLARAGIAQKIAGLFLEAHPQPEQALCDGPCALPLHLLHPVLHELKTLDDLVKSSSNIEIH